MMGEALAVSGVVLLAVFGLAASNYLFDHGVDAAVSRRVPGVLGGLAFLVAVLWLDPWTAVALSGGLTLLVVVLRFGYRRGLRGVRGSLPPQAWAEITYPLAGTVSLAIGWGLLGDRWLAFVPIAFMAWGDSVSGITRDAFAWRSRMPKAWPSIAMLAACLAAAVLFQPYWIGASGAVVATAAERINPRVLSVRDDNWIVMAASLGVMAVLAKIGVGGA